MAKAPWNLSWAIVAILGMGALTPAARAGDRLIIPTKATVPTSNMPAVEEQSRAVLEGALPTGKAVGDYMFQNALRPLKG